MTNPASFSLEKYTFNKVEIDFDSNNLPELEIDFQPSGTFRRTEQESVYELRFVFLAKDKGASKPFVSIECISVFKFAGNILFEEIPSFFYVNSIAIVFPYIRAFVSTVTLQANFPPIVLPTMNLSSLGDPLKQRTREIK